MRRSNVAQGEMSSAYTSVNQMERCHHSFQIGGGAAQEQVERLSQVVLLVRHHRRGQEAPGVAQGASLPLGHTLAAHPPRTHPCQLVCPPLECPARLGRQRRRVASQLLHWIGLQTEFVHNST